MRKPDLYTYYENTRVVHYTELDSELGAATPWRALKETDVSGLPVSIARREDGELYVHTVPDTHVLTIGATRSGKTQSFVIPYAKFLTLRKNKCSMVFTDPKLELFHALAPTLEREGYRIIHLNYTDSSKSDRWNPLCKIYDRYQRYLGVENRVKAVLIDGDYYSELDGVVYKTYYSLECAINAKKRSELAAVQAMVEEIAQTLCVAGSDRDISWMNGGRAIFKGIIYAMLEDSVPGGPRPLITRDNFSFDTLLNIFDRIGSGKCPFTEAYFGKRDHATSIAYKEVQKYLFIKAENTKDGFISTLATAMTALKDGAVRDITCANSFELSDFEDGARPTAIFISMKDETKLYYGVISLFLTDLYTTLIDMTRKNGNKPREYPFYFILDEFGNMPEFKDFDTVISSCGGRNIWFWLIIQSYAQLESVYGKSAEIVKDNLNMHVYLGTNNPETKQSFSNECGKKTVISPLSALNGDSDSITHFVRDEVAAVPVSRLSKMEVGECFITRMNSDVIESRLERYYTCPELIEPFLGEGSYIMPFEAGDPKYEYPVHKIQGDDDDDDDLF